jgi:hypothetical protein
MLQKKQDFLGLLKEAEGGRFLALPKGAPTLRVSGFSKSAGFDRNTKI